MLGFSGKSTIISASHLFNTPNQQPYRRYFHLLPRKKTHHDVTIPSSSSTANVIINICSCPSDRRVSNTASIKRNKGGRNVNFAIRSENPDWFGKLCDNLFFRVLRKKVDYPGILWFAPFVVVPAAMFPAASTITIPETKHNLKWENTLTSIVM